MIEPSPSSCFVKLGVSLRMLSCLLVMLFGLSGIAEGEQKIRLAAVPSISPDGSWFTFVWRGDIWRAPVTGGPVTQLTRHPGADSWPSVSPDGTQIAFTSNRDGAYQIFRMRADGGSPTKVGFHTEGYTPYEWTPDGSALLSGVWRDHGSISPKRIALVPVERGPEQLAFDAYGQDAAMSPDGNRILFCREGEQLYRKGYQGAKSSQIWLYDRTKKTFRLVAGDSGGCRSPMWRGDGKGFYFVRQDATSTFNVFEQNIADGSVPKQLTFHKEEGVIYPKVSRDGSTIIYRMLFDFYRFRPETGNEPEKIELVYEGDELKAERRRRFYSKIWNNDEWGSLDWIEEPLQALFTCGGDLWVMDTSVKDPHRICEGSTGIHEREAIFSPDGSYVLMLRDFGDRVALWRADRKNPKLPWWKNREFALSELISSANGKANLSFSPDGKRLAWSERDRLIVADVDGKNARTIFTAVNYLTYDWAPDSSQMVVQARDAEDNYDIWIVDVDGDKSPYNVSRHPDWDGAPTWSPSGKYIAWLGERGTDRKINVYFAALHSRDEPIDKQVARISDALDEPSEAKPKSDESTEAPKEEKDQKVVIEMELATLPERTHKIAAHADAGAGLFWNHDGTKLAFYGRTGKPGTKTVSIPNDLSLRSFQSAKGTHAQWMKSGKLLWAIDGVPANSGSRFQFKVHQETDLGAYNRLGFRLAWRHFRENFSDPKFNNKDWDKILSKYDAVAGEASDSAAFDRLLNMLFGEVNASHCWFRRKDHEWKTWKSAHAWSVRTHHLGVRLEARPGDVGIVVRAVLPGGPAETGPSRLLVGDVLVRVNGTLVEADMDPTTYLNGPDRDVFEVQVRREGQDELQTVVIDTIDWEKARELAVDAWANQNRKLVDELADSRFAYLHVDRMNWENLEKFTEQIYSRGFDRDGFVIDVRNNLGGFVADRLLNVLCRPIHAVTIARGGHGERSYPRGYLIYWTWDKPIVVLCNQNTVSNGEIFSHAIRTLKRGKLVGVPTEGGVISTPILKILDIGEMGMPNRSWFTINDGEDMEMNGAVPDHVVWPEPGDVPAGRDVQLETAVRVLKEDVAQYLKRDKVPLKYAASRNKTKEEK